jgi:hypothetical protein
MVNCCEAIRRDATASRLGCKREMPRFRWRVAAPVVITSNSLVQESNV